MNRRPLVRLRVEVDYVSDLDVGDIHIAVRDEQSDKRLVDLFIPKEARASDSQKYEWACNGALIYVRDAIMEHAKYGLPSD